MERVSAINPDRVLLGCRERGIEIPQLATDIQLSERMLEDALESGGGLTFTQLQRLARYFNRGVLFYLEPGIPKEEQLYSPQFRTLANQKPKMTPKVRALIQRAERQRDVFLGLREDLGEPAEGIFKPPTMSVTAPGPAGEAAREWLGLERRNTFVTYRKAVEVRGILVFRTNGYAGAWQIPKTDEIEGFCLFDDRCPIIVVKKQESEARQVFTLFHELAHLLLHKSSFIDDQGEMTRKSGVEYEANDFAGHLLAPDSFLDKISLNVKPSDAAGFDDWLRPQRTEWTVSGEVILRRLLDSGKIEQSEYEAYRSWKRKQTFQEESGGTRQYRHREPIHVFGDTFARTVLEALARQRITSTKASRYLDNLKLNDLRQLETYLATH